MNSLNTYAYLFQLGDDIKREIRRSPVFGAFNREKINRFYSLNSIRINSMDNAIQKLQKEYAQFDENGNMITEDINGQSTIKFASDEAKDEYIKKYDEFMSQTIQIHL